MQAVVAKLGANHQSLMAEWRSLNQRIAGSGASRGPVSESSSARELVQASPGAVLLTREQVQQRSTVLPPRPSAPKTKPILNGGDDQRNSQERQLRLLKKVLAAQKGQKSGKEGKKGKEGWQKGQKGGKDGKGPYHDWSSQGWKGGSKEKGKGSQEWTGKNSWYRYNDWQADDNAPAGSSNGGSWDNAPASSSSNGGTWDWRVDAQSDQASIGSNSNDWYGVERGKRESVEFEGEQKEIFFYFVCCVMLNYKNKCVIVEYFFFFRAIAGVFNQERGLVSMFYVMDSCFDGSRLICLRV